MATKSIAARRLRIGGASGIDLIVGSGSPEGSVSAPVGSKYFRTNGDADTAEYFKASGTGTTGWVAVATANPTFTSATISRITRGGTALTASEVAQSGFGSGATKAISGTDEAFQVTITTSVSDTASASPTTTITYKNGTWTTAPLVIVCDAGGTGNVQSWSVGTVTATAVTLVLNGTPSAETSATFKANVWCVK